MYGHECGEGEREGGEGTDFVGVIEDGLEGAVGAFVGVDFSCEVDSLEGVFRFEEVFF
jgi:hypothetical protein